eukprot:CAMPEP_0201713528 /NCGR_PEP_ID=MMETSP0593-20130828/339_1 /ASSEMBLY_ACC=CAM_ASM_000672 /TAXON_ID=267983 /ORGANISM="Skeletonema japonicum, Strain CCMP2506" /LENGTH=303 /DNA_ID=CAMNT_0048202685 /DNA_START=23 /DNA_END=934 /DNA_ORIENTATION=+
MEDPLTIYGQRPQPIETPEFLSTKYTELESELSKIPPEKKTAWTYATQNCPLLVGESHKLMFLRCEVFHVKEAAERICKYWEKRVELFGNVLAYKPLHVGGTQGALHEHSNNTPEDADRVRFTWKGLYLGFMKPTMTHDTGGRAIVFADPSAFRGYNHSTEERYGVARSIWYILHHILEGNDDVQKLGIVVIGYPHNAKISYVDRKLMKMNMEGITGCIPVRMGAFHICHPPWFFEKVVFPIIKVVMPDRMRKRLRTHCGSQEKVLESLKKFGLEREVLPSDIGGDVILDVDGWLQECKKKGL